MESQAEIVPFARPRKRENAAEEVYSFVDLDEILSFVAAEIYKSGDSYSELARRAHICNATVSRLAAGTTKQPRLASVWSLLQALGWRVEAHK